MTIGRIVTLRQRGVGLVVGLGAVLLLTCGRRTPTGPGSEAEVVVVADLSASPNVLGLGGSTATVRAVLVNQNNSPVAGKVVLFSADLGRITPSDTTDPAGVATAIFTSDNRAGRATLTARYGSSSVKTTTVIIDSAVTRSLMIFAEPGEILANGIAKSTLTARVLDAAGKPAKGERVSFETTAGTLLTTGLTDSSGVATAALTSVASATDVVALATVRTLYEQSTTQVLFKGVTFALDVKPTVIIADGHSTADVTVLVKETTSTVAVSDAVITFGTDLGTIPNSATTNARGLATVPLVSSTTRGTARVVARYGNALRDTAYVFFGESVPTTLTLSASPTVLLADNRSTSTIKATVSDAANNPVPDGTPVNFEIVRGSGTLESIKLTQGGVATSTLTSGTRPDTVLVAARVGSLSDTVEVRYVVGPPAAVTVVADSASLPADGITSTRVRAFVKDAVGNPVADGTSVSFTADLGDITSRGQTRAGVAEAQFSSSVTGLATLTARAAEAYGVTTVRLRPGPPNSIVLSFTPRSVGVKDSGRNQTLTITADVRDAKNNPVADGTFVRFSIFSSPGGGEFLSSTAPIPVLNGKAQVSFNSGIRSGAVRIEATVTDGRGVPLTPVVRAISAEIIIFAGPPYLEDVNDPSTSHLSVGVRPLNIVGWNRVNNTAAVTAVVGDKYNNPVTEGTAVYFSTTGGVISTYTGYTDAEGVATVTIHTAQPLPDIDRYYNTFFDPNANHPDFRLPTAVIPGPIPDFDGSLVVNSRGDRGENDGIARLIAVTEGVDATGKAARVWAVTDLVFSGPITTFDVTVSDTSLSPGESATIDIRIFDINGNPIVAGSTISASASAGALSWSNLTTSDPGKTHFTLIITNDLDPTDPNARAQTTPVTISVVSDNGNESASTPPIHLNLR